MAGPGTEQPGWGTVNNKSKQSIIC